MNFNASTGLEQVQRAAFLKLFDNLNDAIQAVQTNWDTSDSTLAAHTGRTYTPLVIEQIAPENFHEGHRPSLIKAPIDNYPNISIYGVRATPNPESALHDHKNVWNNLLFIEVMCKSTSSDAEDPPDAEEIVNRRLVRTCEAVHAVMDDNPTLGGVVTGYEGDLSMSISDVFTRREQTHYGPVWYWQGARLEYVLRKDSVLRSAAPGLNFRALPGGATAADMALIDQA
jgi:hypothetical protein